MKTNEMIKWQEEQALQRYQMIAPLLDESLDNAKRIQLRETIARQNGLSPRTLYRYDSTRGLQTMSLFNYFSICETYCTLYPGSTENGVAGTEGAADFSKGNQVGGSD